MQHVTSIECYVKIDPKTLHHPILLEYIQLMWVMVDYDCYTYNDVFVRNSKLSWWVNKLRVSHGHSTKYWKLDEEPKLSHLS